MGNLEMEGYLKMNLLKCEVLFCLLLSGEVFMLLFFKKKKDRDKFLLVGLHSGPIF